MKYLLFSVAVVFLISCSNDEISEKQTESFIKFYGTANRNLSSDIKPLDDGYVVLGSVNHPDSSYQIYLIKTDEYGNALGDPLTFGGLYADYGYALQVHENGTMYIIGSTVSEPGGTSDMLLYMVNGNEISEPKRFGRAGNEAGYHLEIMESGIIMVGYTDSRNGSKDVYLVFANRNGDMLWSQSYGSNSGEDIGNYVIPYGDNFLITGSTNYNNQANVTNNKNIWVLHAKPRSSNLINSIFIGGNGDDQGIELIPGNDGGVYLAGTMHDEEEDNPSIYLAKFDRNLKMSWDRAYNDLNAITTTDICRWNNNLVVTGTNIVNENSSRISVLVVDEEGDMVTEKYFGDETTTKLSASSVEMTNDEGLILSGTNESFGAGVITIIKLDQNGNL